MSRLIKLKKQKTKKFIKVTILSLSLILMIGHIQTMGTYAWFTDEKALSSKLEISMGNLNVDLGEGFNGDILDKNSLLTKEFYITNTGSLKQKLQLQIEIQGNTIDNEYLDYIEYELNIADNMGNHITTISKTIRDLISPTNIDLSDENCKLVILNADKDTLKCTATIKVKEGLDSEKLKYLSGEELYFNVSVLASQLSYNNGSLVN
ncbi:MAG: TasA family protein, partial [Paraclostridium sp.]